jgi:hypothetical protein
MKVKGKKVSFLFFPFDLFPLTFYLKKVWIQH